MSQSQNIKTSQKSKTRATLKKDIEINMINYFYPITLSRELKGNRVVMKVIAVKVILGG